MKTEFSFVYFSSSCKSEMKPQWHCYNSFTDKIIGKVAYHPPAEEYYYFYDTIVPHSTDMLNEISDFTDQLNKQ